jgi:hypothetical protein
MNGDIIELKVLLSDELDCHLFVLRYVPFVIFSCRYIWCVTAQSLPYTQFTYSVSITVKYN